MGYFAQYVASKEYKRWLRHQWAYRDGYGPMYDEPEIVPLPGSKIKLWQVLNVRVVDDVGVVGHNFDWYIYLYDFVKTGETIKKKQIISKEPNKNTGGIYYNDGLEDRLGGAVQKLGV